MRSVDRALTDPLEHSHQEHMALAGEFEGPPEDNLPLQLFEDPKEFREKHVMIRNET